MTDLATNFCVRETQYHTTNVIQHDLDLEKKLLSHLARCCWLLASEGDLATVKKLWLDRRDTERRKLTYFIMYEKLLQTVFSFFLLAVSCAYYFTIRMSSKKFKWANLSLQQHKESTTLAMNRRIIVLLTWKLSFSFLNEANCVQERLPTCELARRNFNNSDSFNYISLAFACQWYARDPEVSKMN